MVVEDTTRAAPMIRMMRIAHLVRTFAGKVEMMTSMTMDVEDIIE